MQLTYNQFRKAVGKSSDRLFEKFAAIFAESENAALMALYDDKMILLDEDTNQPYLADYSYADGVLHFGSFEPIDLVENDGTVLEQKVNNLFDIVNDPMVSIDELAEGFRLKFYDNAHRDITEARYLKQRMIYENPSIRVKHSVRELRDRNYAMFEELNKKPFVKKLSAKLQLENDNVAKSLNKVDWNPKKGYEVDTNVYRSIAPDIKKIDNSIKKKMRDLAGKLAQLWKTDAFRQKFMNFTMNMKKAEDMEAAMASAENFFEENKELFLLEPSRLDEVVLKTALMNSDTSKDANVVVEIFRKLMQHEDIAAIRESYFDSLGATPEQIAKIMFEQDVEDLPEPEADVDVDVDVEQPKKSKAADDLETEELNDIIAVFRSIRKQLEEDSDEASYVDGIIDDLENAKAKGITDDRMKDIIDFLQGAKEEEGPEEPEEKEAEEEE